MCTRWCTCWRDNSRDPELRSLALNCRNVRQWILELLSRGTEHWSLWHIPHGSGGLQQRFPHGLRVPDGIEWSMRSWQRVDQDFKDLQRDGQISLAGVISRELRF